MASKGRRYPEMRSGHLAEQGQYLMSSWSKHQQEMFNPTPLVENKSSAASQNTKLRETKQHCINTKTTHPRDSISIVTPPSVSNRRRFFRQAPPQDVFGFANYNAGGSLIV